MNGGNHRGPYTTSNDPTGGELPRWQPESPFHDAAPAVIAPWERMPPSPAPVRASPFLNEIGNRLAPADPASEAVTELLAGLHDPEFDVAVSDLVHELSGLASPRPAGEVGDTRAYEARVERAIDERLAPVARAYEDRLDELREQLAPLDAGSVTEVELEALLDRASPPTTALGPAFEFFLKKLWDKTKKAVKGAVGLVKKGVAAVSKLALGPVLIGLRKLIRPLLKKVLQAAMDKIPEKYRPLAEKIAAKLGYAKAGGAASPGSEPGAAAAGAPAAGHAAPDADAAASASSDAQPVSADPTTAPVADVQQELDGRFAELLLARDEMELETVLATHEAEASRPALDPIGELERSRAQFIKAVSGLRDGEDARPAVENFLPALLTAAKLGVKLIGRKRVVSFLGRLLGTLIGPIVGNDIARPLATLVSDVGMKLMGFELSEAEQRQAAGRLIADTLEATVRRVAALPPYVLDHETLLECRAVEAFEAAAAASFPPGLIRPELREAPGVDAMWVPVPPRGRCFYKKLSRTFDVEITRALAADIRGFRGRALDGFLRDVERVTFPVRACLHVFELCAGGRLAHIAELAGVPGLGRADGHRLLHPLTIQAATALLRHPRLGTPFAPAPDPLDPRVGQRFYFLQLARPDGDARMAGQRPGRVSELEAHVDFPRDTIRVRLYAGERAAQSIATALRKSSRGATLVQGLRQVFAADADRLASRDNDGVLCVAVDPPGPGDRASLASVTRDGQHRAIRHELGATIVRWLWTRIADAAQHQADDFVRATEADDEGVTVMVEFAHPPRLPALRRLLRGGAASADDRWPPEVTPPATVHVWAGHRPA
jgi:hypothetical protein